MTTKVLKDWKSFFELKAIPLIESEQLSLFQSQGRRAGWAGLKGRYPGFKNRAKRTGLVRQVGGRRFKVKFAAPNVGRFTGTLANAMSKPGAFGSLRIVRKLKMSRGVKVEKIPYAAKFNNSRRFIGVSSSFVLQIKLDARTHLARRLRILSARHGGIVKVSVT